MNVDGSTYFLFLSEKTGIALEQLNFILSQLFGFIISLVLRALLKPNVHNTKIRHLYCAFFGLISGFFVFGIQLAHIITQSAVSYVLIKYISKKYIHIVIFVFSMAYLSYTHFQRFFHEYGSITVTGSLMVNTQKLTSIAFSLYDGQKSEKKLNEDQKQNALKNNPTFIEFWSYILSYQCLILGPLCFYNEYIEFINGSNVLKHQKNINEEVNYKNEVLIQQPSIMAPVLKKILQLVIIFTIFLKLSPTHTFKDYLNENIITASFLNRCIYLHIAGLREVSCYVGAFLMPEIVANASGLGFNGYDPNGNAKWDLLTNMNVMGFEFSTSFRSIFSSWNIRTHIWFKRICYYRLRSYKTLGVFMLSTLWHPLYPGYLIMFAHITFLLKLNNLIHKTIWPIFQYSSATKIFYSIITFIGTKIAMTYCTVPFLLVTFESSIKYLNSMYWFLTVISVLLTIVLSAVNDKSKSNKPIAAEQHHVNGKEIGKNFKKNKTG